MFVSRQAPIKLALIAANQDTYQAVKKSCTWHGMILHLFVAPYDDMHTVAINLPKDIDVILCRAGTAEHVQDAVTIPVVSIPITPFDLICALEHEDVQSQKLAYLHHRIKLPCIEQVERLFKCKITQYAFTDKESIYQGVLLAKKEGAQACIGGSLSMLSCKEVGIKGIKIYPNKDSIFRCVEEAKNLVLVKREERDKAARLQVVLDTISEGIIVTDHKNNIIIYNPAAARIYKQNECDVIGRNTQEVVPDTHMQTVFDTGEPQLNYLQKIRDDTIAINTLPIMVDNTPIGVVSTFSDVTKIQQLEQIIRKQIHTKGFVSKYTFDDIQTTDEAMLECKQLGSLYANSQGAVIIEGESGTGKELFAQSIHNSSKRAHGPFVAVNCAAIPDTLLESELFGYEGGSFTGARKEGKQGLFELAHNGTIFLDEISELPSTLQARLLRVLQEKEVRRIGGDKIIPVDVRIISATNKDIRKKVVQKSFRDDLFYRLNVFHLKIPPLRARKSDIPSLSAAALKKFNIKPSRELINFLSTRVASHDWPGNVRELHNLMERVALLINSGKTEAQLDHILDTALGTTNKSNDLMHLSIDTSKKLKNITTEIEKIIVSHLLANNENNLDIVAQKLGIGKTSVWRKSK